MNTCSQNLAACFLAAGPLVAGLRQCPLRSPESSRLVTTAECCTTLRNAVTWICDGRWRWAPVMGTDGKRGGKLGTQEGGDSDDQMLQARKARILSLVPYLCTFSEQLKGDCTDTPSTILSGRDTWQTVSTGRRASGGLLATLELHCVFCCGFCRG